MSQSEDSVDLGGLICDAADANNADGAAKIIRSGNFIVFQQIDVESGDAAGEDDSFSVVLAEVDDDTAVVCFSNDGAASNFASEIADELPEGHELPAVMLPGDALLEGLPADCGLLVNPGSDLECYFPPGCFGQL